MIRHILPLLVITALVYGSTADARILYVNASNPAGGDGASWSTAYRYLQDALEQTVSGDEVWVAAGTYFPDDGAAVSEGDRAASFTLKSGVNLYGGFAGTESNRSLADPAANPTILSGEIWPEQMYWSLHVITVLGSVTIEGITITKGNANGEANNYNYGGGILVPIANLTLTVNRCVFIKCSASEGGAVYSFSPLIATHCIFSGNSASSRGGVIYSYISSVIANNCLFSDNTSGYAGGVFQGTNSPEFNATKCTFMGNSASSFGGVISGRITANSSSFINNSAWKGGAISNSSSTTTIVTNSTFFSNTASEGGAFYSGTSSSPFTATNCVFSCNSATNLGGAIRSSSSPITVSYCTLINNEASGSGNRGGAIYTSSGLRIFNNTFWHSIEELQENQIYVTSTGSLRNADTDFPTPQNQAKNLIKGGMSSVILEEGAVLSIGDPSVTILTADPLFVDASNPAGPDGIFGTGDDGLRLLSDSPAIDQGLVRYLPLDIYDLDQDGDTAELIPVDLAGFTRTQGAAPDLGAYEFGGDFPPIVIGSGPESMIVAMGTQATFSVQASGYSVGYQWYLGESGDVSQSVPGATDANFTSDALLATTRFWVRVSNGAGFVGSQTATATVVPVKITSQPQSGIVATGSAADLSVTAQGLELQFQWYRGVSGDKSQPLAGANSPDYRTVVLSEDAEFWVEITGLHGVANSDSALIRVTEDQLAAALFAGSKLFYSTGGDAGWFVQSETTHSGGEAIQSGLITHNQSSYVETTVETAGTLDFWWRVSSQSSYDFLRFYINGVEQSGKISGTTGSWAQETITVTTDGPHVFRWAYTKNASTTSGSDCGWLDDVRWTPKLISTQPAGDRILAGTTAHMAVNTNGSGLSYQWYEGESDIQTDPITGANGPDLTTAVLDANRKYWVKVGNGVGFESSETSLVQVYPPDTAIAAALGSGEGIGYFTWGNQPWVIQSETTFDGSQAMRSGAIDHAQLSVLEAVVTGPGQLNFRWKVSSELGYDFLNFSIDGVQQGGISGVVDWQQADYQLTGSGSHRLRWDYRKDETKTSGSDRGWLDAVVWTPDGSTLTYLAWAAAHGLTGNDALKTASPANDGVSNLMKFALGLDPNESPPAVTDGTNPGLPMMEMDDDFIRFVFIKDTAKSGLTYTVETCVELGAWESVTDAISETPLEGTKVRVTASLPRMTKQFCRLKVSE